MKSQLKTHPKSTANTQEVLTTITKRTSKMAELSLTVFAFQNQEIRTISNNDGVWFCLIDILKNIETSTTTAQSKVLLEEVFGEGYKIVIPLQTNGGTQETIFVSESATTFLISRSRTESGKKLNRWIHLEILPSIRKTGQYQLKPLSPAEMLLASAQQLVDHEKRLEAIESKTSELEDFVHQHDGEIDRIFNPNGHYYSVVGYACRIGKKVSIKQASDIGRKCSNYCRKNSIHSDKLTDPRFGTVGVYPESVIKMFLN